jgi:hypothetical protein
MGGKKTEKKCSNTSPINISKLIKEKNGGTVVFI